MKKNAIFVGAMLVVSTKIFAQQKKLDSVKLPTYVQIVDKTEGIKINNIEEVTIASKIPQQLYETGKNVKLLTEKDLEKYHGQSLNDVLDQVAGIQISGNFNNNSEPKSMEIRGGRNTNVLILLDGVPLKDVTGNDYTVSDLRLVALENIDSIEILNGASSVLYGSNATVSVINIKTKKSSQKKIEGLLSARGGSFSTFAQNALLKGKIEKFNYQIAGFNEKSDGISSALGDDSYDKDGFEKQNVSANVGFTDKNVEINVNSGWNHHLYKYDNGAFSDGFQRGNDQQFYVGGNAGFTYNKGKLTLNIRNSTTNRMLQDLVANSYQDQYHYKGDDFFAELFNSYKINEKLNFVAGIQYEKQSMSFSELPWSGTSMEDVLKFEDTNTASFDAFLNANFKYHEFHLDAGTRLTNHSKFGNHLVYSINPYYLKEMDALYFKIGYSFATAFIAPTLYQNFGALPWVLPNFDLKPETNQSHEIDVNIGKKDRSLNVTASIFQRQEKDVFAYQITDFTTYAGKFLNVDENKVKGFELGFDYKINEIIKLGGNFSYVEKDKEATMLRQPKQRINSYLELLPFKQTRISISHLFVGTRADSYYDSNTYSVKNVEDASYHLLNLNINQKIIKNLETYLNVGNLFNTSYVDVVGYTTEPRNYTLGVSYKF